MFLTNVATSAAQQQGISYDSLGAASYSIRSSNSVIFHGANVGAEVVW